MYTISLEVFQNILSHGIRDVNRFFKPVFRARNERAVEHHSRNRGGNQDFLKQVNRRKVLNLLRSGGPLSRTELALASGLDNKSITNIANHFLERRIVVSTGLRESSSGRRKEHLKINSDHAFAIGLDLGASHITGILLDLDGQAAGEKSCTFRFGLGGSIILERLMVLTRALIEESRVAPSSILGIGFTAPGFHDKERGVWEIAYNISGWKSLPIGEILRSEFRLDVFLQDCSRSMALAEMWYGEGKRLDNFVLLDLGQGIGLGIVIDGRLYEGSNGKSGEVGHLVVDPGGRECSCGNRGCLEATASGTAIAGIVTDEVKRGVRSKVLEVVNGRVDEITALDVVQAANHGDPLAVEVMRKAGLSIGKALSYVINLLNPGLVILGGQLANAGPCLIDPLVESAGGFTLPGLFRDTSIKISKLGRLSASVGAATIVLNEKVFKL